MRLTIELDTTEPVLPGATVSGSVRVWHSGATARSLRIRLALIERTADVAQMVLRACEQRIAAGPLAAGAHVPFCLTLPADAPPSGGSLAWELRAWADVRGPDPSAVRSVRVVAQY